MARKKKEERPADQEATAQQQEVDTPLWDRYYRAMRKHIRYPRYYKKALNW